MILYQHCTICDKVLEDEGKWVDRSQKGGEYDLASSIYHYACANKYAQNLIKKYGIEGIEAAYVEEMLYQLVKSNGQDERKKTRDKISGGIKND